MGMNQVEESREGKLSFLPPVMMGCSDEETAPATLPEGVAGDMFNECSGK
jgi:hypothetical protein